MRSPGVHCEPAACRARRAHLWPAGNDARAIADYAEYEAADPRLPGEQAMNILKLVHVVIAQAFYRWALSEMNPLHPDLPQMVLRQQELADEARRLLA